MALYRVNPTMWPATHIHSRRRPQTNTGAMPATLPLREALNKSMPSGWFEDPASGPEDPVQRTTVMW